MTAVSIVDVLRSVDREYQRRTKKIQTPNNEAYEALMKDTDTIIYNFQIQQKEAYKEAEKAMFF